MRFKNANVIKKDIEKKKEKLTKMVKRGDKIEALQMDTVRSVTSSE